MTAQVFSDRMRLSKCLEEVTRGVGETWSQYRMVGATRGGLAPAKEGVGKNPERYKLVEPGSIFYNPMRILLGSIALLDEGQPPGITSPDYVVFKTRPGVVHPRWFYFWLRSEGGEAFIRTLARGAVRERMLFRRLAEAEIEIPAIESQRWFAWAVSCVERARVAAEAQLEAAKAFSDACIRESFRDSQRQKLRLAECLVEISEGVGASWAQYPVLGATRAGIAPAKDTVGKAPARYKLVDAGTIFYNPMRILLGSIAMVDEGDKPGITSPDYVVFTTKLGRLHPRWFYNWLRGHEGAAFIRTLARGAVRERMLFRRLAEAEMEAPSWRSQVVAAERMLGTKSTVRRIAEEVTQIKGLPAALLRRAFSGEL
jgi:type I restriction enzyme S subunit